MADASKAFLVKTGAMALAAGALAAPLAAEASVVVTQVDPNSSVVFVDFAGNTEFVLVPPGGPVFTAAPGQAVSQVAAKFATILGNAANGIYASAATGFVIPLGGGAVIGPDLFTPDTTSNPAKFGPPEPGSIYFIGLDVVPPPVASQGGLTALNIAGGGDNYGWVAIGDQGPIAYAFETDPGVNIVTPASLPEPASLALLAIGAIGAAGIRRRSARA